MRKDQQLVLDDRQTGDASSFGIAADCGEAKAEHGAMPYKPKKQEGGHEPERRARDVPKKRRLADGLEDGELPLRRCRVGIGGRECLRVADQKLQTFRDIEHPKRYDE